LKCQRILKTPENASLEVAQTALRPMLYIEVSSLGLLFFHDAASVGLKFTFSLSAEKGRFFSCEL